MALLDLLGRRWTLRVVWELRNGPMTSRALRKACGGVSPTVLNDRTKELREAGLLRLDEQAGYELTPLGREALRALPAADAMVRALGGRDGPSGSIRRRVGDHGHRFVGHEAPPANLGKMDVAVP